ncbi:MAG: hypothetical protein V2I27_14805 [Erythrobacter sp.]|nr:hypothetical protein [Erythrobacter sp.]
MKSFPFPAVLGSSQGPLCPPLARAIAHRAERRIANDNVEGGLAHGPAMRRHRPADELLLRAALRHFAEHGLGAARAARAQAEAAFFAGDRQGYDWWLGITRTLDRRLAAEAERPVASLGPKAPPGSKPRRK